MGWLSLRTRKVTCVLYYRSIGAVHISDISIALSVHACLLHVVRRDMILDPRE